MIILNARKQPWEHKDYDADYQYWLKSIGDPGRDRRKLVATSPLTYATGYGATVLLIHGQADVIVPIAQSRAMEAALRRDGRPVRLIEVPGEGHGTWQPGTEASALREMLVFVDRAIGAGK